MKWILYSDDVCLYLSGKDSGSNPSRTTQVCVDLCPSRSFEAKSFPLKFNPPTFEYKIHSVEVDLYYFKYL